MVEELRRGRALTPSVPAVRNLASRQPPEECPAHPTLDLRGTRHAWRRPPPALDRHARGDREIS
jgi:hypothetical protein